MLKGVAEGFLNECLSKVSVKAETKEQVRELLLGVGEEQVEEFLSSLAGVWNERASEISLKSFFEMSGIGADGLRIMVMKEVAQLLGWIEGGYRSREEVEDSVKDFYGWLELWVRVREKS